MPGGRPTTYTAETGDAINELVACGVSMRQITREEGMPAISTIFLWLRTHSEFSEQYEKAKFQGCLAMAEEILSIADDGVNDYMEGLAKDGEAEAYRLNGENIQRSRLRVDSRKWLLSKIAPKKYGEKLETTHKGGMSFTDLTDEQLNARLAALANADAES